MQRCKTVLSVVFALILSGPTQSFCALTANYGTTAHALAEVGWHDYYGYYWDSDIDSAQETNNQSYASAYYDRIQYMGDVGISALASASIEPNEVILATRVAGSYKFDVGWELMDYCCQDANDLDLFTQYWLLPPDPNQMPWLVCSVIVLHCPQERASLESEEAR